MAVARLHHDGRLADFGHDLQCTAMSPRQTKQTTTQPVHVPRVCWATTRLLSRKVRAQHGRAARLAGCVHTLVVIVTSTLHLRLTSLRACAALIGSSRLLFSSWLRGSRPVVSGGRRGKGRWGERTVEGEGAAALKGYQLLIASWKH